MLIFLLGAALVLVSSSYNRIGLSLARETVQQMEAKLPIVDFDDPESGDKGRREKRRNKGRKYNKANLPVNPSPDVRTTTSVSHWFYGMPSLPTLQSDVIVIEK